MAITAAAPEAFGIKFQEALDYLKAKLPEGTQAWDDLAGPVHAKVFAVAGATKVDLVQDLHSAITRAIEQGRTITDFRKDFDKAVQAHGWSYKGKRGWRTRVIYDANMRSAHMAGRWAQIQANKDRKPYLQYLTAGDSRVRPQHRQWDGLVYPVDHPFWDTHYPPNGWGCRCTIRPRSAADVEEMGLIVQTQSPKMASRMVVNQDGEITDIVPNGIDAGWDHNVGQSWIAPEMALGQKLARLLLWLRGQMSKKAVSPAFQSVISSNYRAMRAQVSTTKRAQGDIQILGYLDQTTLDALQQHVPDLDLESTVIAAIDRNTRHLEQWHKSSGPQFWPRDWFDRVPEFLADYRAVLWDSMPGDEALVIIPKAQYNDALAKIVLKPNFKTKHGKVLSVRSYGASDRRNLEDTFVVNGVRQRRYKLLAGGL